MEKFKYINKNKMSRLPETPGVYAFKKGREFLYIGKAVNLRARVKQHQSEVVSRLAGHIAYIETGSENEALILENELIKKYRPKYNTQWKDDKNYFYVGITKEAYPRIFITHQPNSPLKPGFNKFVEAMFLGPFVDGKTLKETLKKLRKTYPYRTCKTLPRKPCLWYHLNQCPAPCLPAEVPPSGTKEGLFPTRHIEAYDISNIQGKEATGSMVTFINGKPDKNSYRRFKIKGLAKPNDIAMLKEILSRRLKHAEWPYPDLMLIDGGRAQLNAALRCLKFHFTQACVKWNFKHLRVLALAKGKNKLYSDNNKNPILLKNLPSKTANLILRARDEAHRFARKYHHYLRDRALLN